MSMKEFAKSELDRIGMTDDDPTGEDMNFHMREHILRMVDEFSKEGHSGFSAHYAINVLKKLLAMERKKIIVFKIAVKGFIKMIPIY